MTTILVNIILVLMYSVFCAAVLIPVIQRIRGDQKRAERDEERKACNKEDHEKQMQELK